MRLKVMGYCVAGIMFCFLWGAGCGDSPGEKELARARKALTKERYVIAREALEKSVGKRPGSKENAVAYNLLGLTHMKLGDTREATRYFDESRATDPDLFGPSYNIGVLHYKAERYEQAAVAFNEASMINEQDGRSMLYLGLCHMKLDKWKEATRVLYSALEREESPEILSAIGMIELKNGNAEAAQTFMQKAIQQDATFAAGYYNLGLLEKNWGDNGLQAALQFEKYLEHAPPSERTRTIQTLKDELLEKRAAPSEKSRVIQVANIDRTLSVAQPFPDEEPELGSREPPSGEEKSPVSRVEDDSLEAAKKLAASGRIQQAVDLCLDIAAKAERMGRKSDLKQALDAALEMAPDIAETQFEMGRFLLSQRQSRKALNHFKKAVVIDPEWVRGLTGLATAAIKVGEHDAALISLKKAIEVEPENAEVLWALARLYDQKLNEKSKAREAYSMFHERFPNHARAELAQRRVVALKEEVKKAVEAGSSEEPSGAMTEEAEVPPNGLPRISDATPPPRDASHVRANPPPRNRPPEQDSEAVDQPDNIQTAVPLRPARNPSVEEARQAYNRGNIYLARQDWDRAIYHFLLAVENDPTFVRAYYNMGIAYNNKGNKTLAKDAYRRALAIEPNLVNARFNLGLIYREEGRLNHAVKLFNEIIAASPNHAQSHFLLGTIYERQQDAHPLARKHYTAYLKLDPRGQNATKARQWLLQRRTNN